MILILDEFDNAHQAKSLDADVIRAINDGNYLAYRFDPDNGKIQKYDGRDWVDIKKWPGT